MAKFSRTAGFLLALLALMLCGGAAADTIRGKLTLGSGFLQHPIGLADEPEAAYFSEVLQLATSFGEQTNLLKLGYEGNGIQFTNNTNLGSHKHGLGLEWFRYSRDGRDSFSAGVQAALRRYQGFYRVFDYSEANGYLAFKKYLGATTLLRGYAALKQRRYDERTEESYREPYGQLTLQRFLKSRTTLGLTVRIGAKYYFEPDASLLWGTPDLPSTSQSATRPNSTSDQAASLSTPSTSQLSTRFNFAQGFSQGCALRGWVDGRWTLSEFPRSVEDIGYDSPLLDRYAHEGVDVFLALKYLMPGQFWLEGGTTLGEHDYGSLLFTVPGDDDGQTRVDQLRDYYLSAEKTLPRKIGSPTLRLGAGWKDQDSTHASYSYEGIYAYSSLSWIW